MANYQFTKIIDPGNNELANRPKCFLTIIDLRKNNALNKVRYHTGSCAPPHPIAYTCASKSWSVGTVRQILMYWFLKLPVPYKLKFKPRISNHSLFAYRSKDLSICRSLAVRKVAIYRYRSTENQVANQRYRSSKKVAKLHRLCERSRTYTGWQRYFRNNFRVCPMHQK